MTLLPPETRILVPVELPEPDDIAQEMVDLLVDTRVVLLGWFETPDQLSPEQARDEIDDTGEERLEALADKFRDAGVETEVRHVFTPDLVDTVGRVAREEGCDAALLNGPLVSYGGIVVLLRDAVAPDPVAPLLARLASASDGPVRLLRSPDARGDEDPMASALAEHDVDEDRIEVHYLDDDGAWGDVKREGDEVVVIPEVAELEEQIVGDFAREIVGTTEGPVLVVRARAAP